MHYTEEITYVQSNVVNPTYFVSSNNVRLARLSDYWDRTNANYENKGDIALYNLQYVQYDVPKLGSNGDSKTSNQGIHCAVLYCTQYFVL